MTEETRLSIDMWLVAAARELPYYSRAIAALTPINKPGFHTLAVDKYWRLYWSQEAMKKLEGEGNAPIALIQHELEHLLRQHNSRCNGRINTLWNYCCDAEINDD